MFTPTASATVPRMEWLEGVDWGAIAGVVGTSAAVATAVSVGVTLWLSIRNRPEPDWAIVGHASRPNFRDEEQRVGLVGTLINAGDGAAFRVHLSGVNCEPALLGEEYGLVGDRPVMRFAPVVAPGEEWPIRLLAVQDQWDSASVRIEWTRSPTRLGKRDKDQIPVREIADLPPPRGEE